MNKIPTFEKLKTINMKLKDVRLQHFGDFETEDNENWGSLDSENPVAIFHADKWITGYFSAIGISKGDESVYSEVTLDEAFELLKTEENGGIYFNGFSDFEKEDLDYKELNPEMEVYHTEALGSLAHEVNLDKGQPQRAAMNYIINQARFSNIPEGEFYELIKDAAHQLSEDYKEENVIL